MAVAGTALHDGVGGFVLVDAVQTDSHRGGRGCSAMAIARIASHRHALGLGLVRSVYCVGCVGP
jgi:hypothetical protein